MLRSLRVRNPHIGASRIYRERNAAVTLNTLLRSLRVRLHGRRSIQILWDVNVPIGIWVCRICREQNSAAMASNVTIASRSQPTEMGVYRIRRERNSAVTLNTLLRSLRVRNPQKLVHPEFVHNKIRPQWRQMLRSLRVRNPQRWVYAEFVGNKICLQRRRHNEFVWNEIRPLHPQDTLNNKKGPRRPYKRNLFT